MKTLKLTTLISGIFFLVVGTLILVFSLILNNEINQAQFNNSQAGQKKVKNNKCQQISESSKVAILGNFCNANTPSTWQNNQKLAKSFYPKDMDGHKALYNDNKSPSPFYSASNTFYGERERQVESAQLLGLSQGKLKSMTWFSVFMILIGIANILVSIFNE